MQRIDLIHQHVQGTNSYKNFNQKLNTKFQVCDLDLKVTQGES